jgi:cytochrome c oxidase assembly protein subunit 17
MMRMDRGIGNWLAVGFDLVVLQELYQFSPTNRRCFLVLVECKRQQQGHRLRKNGLVLQRLSLPLPSQFTATGNTNIFVLGGNNFKTLKFLFVEQLILSLLGNAVVYFNNRNAYDQHYAMSSQVQTVQSVDPATGETKTLKMCCACPETKRERDNCVLLNGEEACSVAIEAHKTCLRKAGFNIP